MLMPTSKEKVRYIQASRCNINHINTCHPSSVDLGKMQLRLTISFSKIESKGPYDFFHKRVEPPIYTFKFMLLMISRRFLDSMLQYLFYKQLDFKYVINITNFDYLVFFSSTEWQKMVFETRAKCPLKHFVDKKRFHSGNVQFMLKPW